MKLLNATHKKILLAGLALGLIAVPGMAQSKKKASKTAIISADTSLNTRYNEIKPVVSPDGTRLYFGRSNHPSSAGGNMDRSDAWVATRSTSEMFGGVQRLESLNNSPQADLVAGFSPSGDQLYIMRNNPNTSNKGDAGLYVVSAAGNDNPKPVTVNYFYNKAKHQDITLAPDGETMLLSLESYSTYGLEDIYVSFRQANGSWSEPLNLGPQINTPRQEMSAFLAADRRTLYFASNRSGGQGSMDIWVSTRLDNSWKNWSKPKNLGTSVNTSGSEMYYYEPEAGEWGYYTSSQNSEGFGDIKRVRKPELPVAPALEETAPPIVTATVPVPLVQTPEEAPTAEEIVAAVDPEPAPTTITLQGQVKGADGKAPLAKVIVRGDGYADSISAASTYSIALPQTGKYSIIAKAKGYLSVDTVLDVPQSVAQLNFSLRPLAVGTTVRLENVMFQQSTAVLIEISAASLDKVVQMLRENPSMEIMLTGHTDNQGSSRANIKLSQQRVEAVKSYLISRGIAEDRLQGKGYGGTRPVASNASEETRKLNRRVEFVILKE